MRFGAMSAIALGWSLGLAGSAVAEEGGIYLGGDITLTSDYMFRGVSQTLGDPAAHAWLDVKLESGVYGYVWAANVDFVPAGEQADGARYETNTAVGFAAEFSEAWSVDTLLVRYLFPGTVESVNYDYNELLITLGYHDTYGGTGELFLPQTVGSCVVLSLDFEFER